MKNAFVLISTCNCGAGDGCRTVFYWVCLPCWARPVDEPQRSAHIRRNQPSLFRPSPAGAAPWSHSDGEPGESPFARYDRPADDSGGQCVEQGLPIFSLMSTGLFCAASTQVVLSVMYFLTFAGRSPRSPRRAKQDRRRSVDRSRSRKSGRVAEVETAAVGCGASSAVAMHLHAIFTTLP